MRVITLLLICMLMGCGIIACTTDTQRFFYNPDL